MVAGVQEVDAVVVGAGHHGLVAAAVLADAGWDVLVLEEQPRVGGAVASRESGGWVEDEFSACHPLAVVSPVLRELDLAAHGLEWAHAERPLAHLGLPDSPPVALHADAARTAAALEADHPGDGDAWLELVALWQRLKDPFLRALLTRWPPVRDAARIAARVGLADVPDLARFALLPVSQMGMEHFRGEGGRQLLTGNALHADIPPTAPGSGLFGWIMSMLAQDAGFPSPRGGTRRLAEALLRRAQSAGARVEVATPVGRIWLRGNRIHGVSTASGRRIRARRAVIADTSAPALYGRLLAQDDVPPGLRRRMGRFTWDLPTVKLNYRLSQPVPWTSSVARGAAVVHAGQDLDGMVRWSADLEARTLPRRPFALVGQMSTIDATRSPAGTEALWLYTHLPRHETDLAGATSRAVEASEAMLESLAPGFGDTVLDRWDQGPADLEAADANLGAGAVAGGTQQLFQQAVWRPVTGLGGPRTHVDGLYLGSAAIHPGGGVHGGCGYLAARAALQDSRWWGVPRRKASLAALHRLYDA